MFPEHYNQKTSPVDGDKILLADSQASDETKWATVANLIGDAIAKSVANLVDSSPEALDTLNELAAALGDDPNFATTVTNALAAKAPLSRARLVGPIIAAEGGNEGGEFYLEAPPAGSVLEGDSIAIDSYENVFRVRDMGGDGKGFRLDFSEGLPYAASKIYHQGYKPTAADVGAVALTGGNMSGLLNVKKPSDFWSGMFVSVNDLGYLGSNGAYCTSLYSNGYRNISGEFTSFGVNGNTAASGIDLSPDGKVYIRGGEPNGTSIPKLVEISQTKFEYKNQEVYHTGNKPTAADVGSAQRKAYVYKNSSYTLTSSDAWKFFGFGRICVATLPDASVFKSGDEIDFVNINKGGSNTVTIKTNGELINNQGGFTSVVLSPGESITFYVAAADMWFVK